MGLVKLKVPLPILTLNVRALSPFYTFIRQLVDIKTGLVTHSESFLCLLNTINAIYYTNMCIIIFNIILN